MGSSKPRAPNPECSICGVYYTTVYVDSARATLNDLVEDFLKLGLGYGDKEFSIIGEADTLLYDPEETENLDKKLSELGIRQDTFLTVKDEDDDGEVFVNVILNIQEA